MRYIIFILTIIITGVACNSSPKQDSQSSNLAQWEDSLNQINWEDEKEVDDFSLFRNMIDSIYPDIKKAGFDTLKVNGIVKNDKPETNRMINRIILKNMAGKNETQKITGIYQCICKHKSIQKQDSEDLVIEEFVCEENADADFWFGKLYDCYFNYETAIVEPLKEPYKIWQSSNRIVHVYTRAQMWAEDMEAVNKSLMMNFVYTAKEE